MIVLAVAVAGALGALTRYLVDGFVAERVKGVFPWGTFVINVTGSLLLGFLTGLALYHGLGSTAKAWIGAGFCGAYTTFSTFAFETMRLAEDGSTYEAMLSSSN